MLSLGSTAASEHIRYEGLNAFGPSKFISRAMKVPNYLQPACKDHF